MGRHRYRIFWGNIFFVLCIFGGGFGSCGLLVHEYRRSQEQVAEERVYNERIRLLAEKARLKAYDRIWQQRQIQAVDSAMMPAPSGNLAQH